VKLMKGMPVVKAILAECAKTETAGPAADLLKPAREADGTGTAVPAGSARGEQNVRRPCLAIVRVGENPSDLSYERGAQKRLSQAGAECRREIFPADVTAEKLAAALDSLAADDTVDGILMFRPLPGNLPAEELAERIPPEKDMDCASRESLGKFFAGDSDAIAPCTAQAVIEVLKHYQIPMEGKRAVVIGRSLVIGKPAAMLLLAQNATVTVCHSRTRDLAEICRGADILVAAVGKEAFVKPGWIKPGAAVVDVGIHVSADGSLAGDVDPAAYDLPDGYITPVPGGLGPVTSAVLARHVVEAAEKRR
jgi:methylenetetrahydrofolate dehydrogenase (NADP+)/methenyltetrahydrofolate cyclohydrolase